MKKVFFGLLFFTAALNAQQVNYFPLPLTPTTGDAAYGIIRNPERGYYYPYSSIDDDYIPNASLPFQYTKLTQGDIDYAVGLGANLIQRIVRLDDFKSNPQIPAAFIQNIKDDLNLLKANGIKCILRFSYSYYTNYTNHTGHVYDAPESIITGTTSYPGGHIEQLKAVTRDVAYEPIISSVEAGFIGNWGEWVYSSNFGNPDILPGITSAHLAARQRVGQKILTLTSNRLVAYRTPFIQKQITDLGYKMSPIVNAAPGNGDGETAPASRVAAHNDCFLSEENDQGTYDYGSTAIPYELDRNYLKNQSIHTFDGGEFCGLDENYANLNVTPTGPSGSFIGNAIKQMEDFHFNYLNLADDPEYPDVIHYWKTHSYPLPSQKGTYYNEVNRRLGYRFELVNSNVNTTTKNLTITLKNVGFAKLFNFRKVYLVLRNTVPNSVPQEYRVRLMTTDPRDWLAHPTNTYTITKNLINMVTTTVGGEPVLNGTYKLYLYMPDNKLSDVKYCIRFANANIGTSETFWNTSATLPGYNNLYKTVTIDNSGSGTVSKLSEDDMRTYFEATAYPNPFATAFNIKVNTLAEGTINLSVYDMLGRLIDTKQSNPANINSLEIGTEYPTGVYTIVVSQGASKQSIRVIKK